MITRLCLIPLILLSLTVQHVSGDDEVRSVQEELRRRNLYFGDIDGRESGEVDEAVKRYQRRKGLRTAGVRDADTLRSLGLGSRGAPPKGLDLPDEPVLRSDVTINVVEAANEIAEETGVAPVAIIGEKLAGTDAAQRSSRRGKARLAGQPSSARGERPPGSTGASGETRAVLTPAELREFVRDFLDAASEKETRNELRFYADRLDYYNNKGIDRRLIERSLQRYHAQWPSRRYRLGGAFSSSFNAARAEITVNYQVAFTLKGRGKRASGYTRNRMVINAATSDPRIVLIEEQRGR